jgi:DNA-directed RNA polymerase subunit RPC12/RpoP
MTIYCKDCSYRGKTSGQGGECPACGSFNLTRGQPVKEQEPHPKWRLVLLVGLWTYLIAMIIWKLLH